MNIAFIPVRGGSKSIPLKNIKLLCKQPLIYWTTSAAVNAICVDRTIIATDSIEIKETVKKLNLSKVTIYDRQPENASDTSSTESIMLEFINRHHFKDDDYFLLIQATSPLLKSNDIDLAYKKLINEKADSLLTVVRNKRFYWNKSGQPINYNYQHRPRRQDFDGIFMENGALYINSIGNIKRDNNRLSGKIALYEMPEYTGFEMDESDDWFIVEQLMKRYIAKNIPLKTQNQIKLFVMDVDGVLTDGGMYYSESGEELKKFNTRDAMGLEMLRNQGIKTAIITGENTNSVKNRAKKIKVDYVFQGVTDKAKILEKLCNDTGISLTETAYIGDDVNDLSAIKIVGLSACPANAVDEVKDKVDLVLNKNGGDGAVRDWCERIIAKPADTF
ncbi:MAG: acylneuraminate cytidylyltransferase [Planctomycetaceae bacterium]|jgi:N-acylneuraminate cytidylyltransferase|nr:acylneuraminate cytidylyltransferase [Planctomycetaceae bacterium]